MSKIEGNLLISYFQTLKYLLFMKIHSYVNSYACHGLMTATPVGSKSATFRVTTVMP